MKHIWLVFIVAALVNAEWQRLAVVVRRAFNRTGLSDKEIAAALGITQQQFSAQMAGREQLSVWRLAGLGRAFFQNFSELLAAEYGVSVETRRAMSLALGVMGRRRMERMSSPRKAECAS